MQDEAAMLEPIRQAALVENVYERLRHAILSGTLRPGARLVEDQLAAQLAVSRAPVRDALRALEADGLVASHARRGKVVTTLSGRDAWEVYSLRSTLEAMAIRLTIGAQHGDLLERLDAIVGEMQVASKAKDLTALARLDVEFHDSVSQASGHTRLVRALEGMHDQIRLLSLQVLDTLYADSVDVAARHARLVAAIRAGDGDAAEEAVREHIESVAVRVVGAVTDAETTEQVAVNPFAPAAAGAGRSKGGRATP
jgi:DNA-binding GntR family transcriptional regulator